MFKILFFALISTFVYADEPDLDDIKLYDIVKVEHCLDQAYDRIPGYARKLEFKIEGDDPIYEFDIESKKDGTFYNVECNAEEGFIIEVEREVDANDPVFKNAAKISIDQARKTWTDVIESKGMQYPNVSQLQGWNSPIVKDYKITATPTYFLLNNKGEIVLKPKRIYEVDNFLKQNL